MTEGEKIRWGQYILKQPLQKTWNQENLILPTDMAQLKFSYTAGKSVNLYKQYGKLFMPT